MTTVAATPTVRTAQPQTRQAAAAPPPIVNQSQVHSAALPPHTHVTAPAPHARPKASQGRAPARQPTQLYSNAPQAAQPYGSAPPRAPPSAGPSHAPRGTQVQNYWDAQEEMEMLDDLDADMEE